MAAGNENIVPQNSDRGKGAGTPTRSLEEQLDALAVSAQETHPEATKSNSSNIQPGRHVRPVFKLDPSPYRINYPPLSVDKIRIPSDVHATWIRPGRKAEKWPYRVIPESFDKNALVAIVEGTTFYEAKSNTNGDGLGHDSTIGIAVRWGGSNTENICLRLEAPRIPPSNQQVVLVAIIKALESFHSIKSKLVPGGNSSGSSSVQELAPTIKELEIRFLRQTVWSRLSTWFIEESGNINVIKETGDVNDARLFKYISWLVTGLSLEGVTVYFSRHVERGCDRDDFLPPFSDGSLKKTMLEDVDKALDLPAITADSVLPPELAVQFRPSSDPA